MSLNLDLSGVFSQWGLWVLGRKMTKMKWPSHHIWWGTRCHHSLLLGLLTLITWSEWCLPGFSAANLLFSPFHILFIRNESKVQSTLRRRRNSFHILEWGASENLWMYVKTASVITGIPHFIALHRYYVFLQIKDLCNPAFGKSMRTIFPTTFAHFISLSHFGNFDNMSNMFTIIIFIMVIYD